MKVGQKVIIVEEEQDFHFLSPMTIATIVECHPNGRIRAAGKSRGHGEVITQWLKPEHYELIPDGTLEEHLE